MKVLHYFNRETSEKKKVRITFTNSENLETANIVRKVYSTHIVSVYVFRQFVAFHILVRSHVFTKPPKR